MAPAVRGCACRGDTGGGGLGGGSPGQSGIPSRRPESEAKSLSPSTGRIPTGGALAGNGSQPLCGGGAFIGRGASTAAWGTLWSETAIAGDCIICACAPMAMGGALLGHASAGCSTESEGRALAGGCLQGGCDGCAGGCLQGGCGSPMEKPFGGAFGSNCVHLGDASPVDANPSSVASSLWCPL